jgi:hypothetical protein
MGISEYQDYDRAVRLGRFYSFRRNNTLTDSEFAGWLHTLRIIRDRLRTSSKGGRPRNDSETGVPSPTWIGYCKAIGVSKRVVNRWLSMGVE